MKYTTPEVVRSGLMPAEAADIIRYYDDSENKAVYDNNWRIPKVKLGQIAIHTTQSRHSILQSGEPMLTIEEAAEGLEYLLKEKEMPSPKPETVQTWPVDPTDEQWGRIEKLEETRNLITAYEMVMGIRVY